jgi:GTP-binding protein Era
VIDPESWLKAPPDVGEGFRAGFVAVVGRPNVGKSTLVNALVGQKVSITTPRPQTTRQAVLGIYTTEKQQMVLIDTPGIHQKAVRQINKMMNRIALGSLAHADLVLLLLDSARLTDEDERVMAHLEGCQAPVIVVLNKIDLISEKAKLLPLIDLLKDKVKFVDIVPLSALKGEGLEQLESCVYENLHESGMLYDPDQITDRTDRFLIAEIVREKLMLFLEQELPYSMAVEIEKLDKDYHKGWQIHALIWVERDSQKGIVIGKQGSMLKKIGISARREIEEAFQEHVDLRLWVKVKSGWADDQRALKSFGIQELS